MLDGLLTPAECGVLLQLAKVRPMSRWHSWLVRDPQAQPPAPSSGFSHSPVWTGLATAPPLWTGSFSSQLRGHGMDILYKEILLEVDMKNKTK